ncbi:molybdopterin-dependent oxidoreductase [Haloplanus rubicundus]|uniref:Sulfite oxidase n=1 Tax=Haloplanus rubicundus TaxID=1547898 RepID=A0A345EBN5_9EURY|nr:molybdopterin-dependent oxidoreductase [Haloplanus rubicundus]AXG09607.1 sulfite oxidase [Haloplanus rubicundus]
MSLRARLAHLDPPPRLVDWSLFALVGLAAATGLTSFWVGHPSDAAIFWIHAVAGLSIPPLLVVKFRRVAGRVRDRRAWDRATPLSILLAAVAVAAAATGVAWAVGVVVPLGFWTLLNLHILFGLLLVPLLLVHLRARYRPLRRTDVRERRVALQYAGLVVAAGVTSAGLRGLATLFGTPAATRRFTGSRALDSDADLPVTSWVADDPDPVDPTTWTLSVGGLVGRPLELGVDDLNPTAERQALLDCTSGWYAERDWRGVRLGDLLDVAGASEDAAWVTVRSVTGYRWSLPLDEARDAVLATHLSGERLDHGHGYPIRLVAPGRRGFQWVKWVEGIEVRRRPDPRQWIAIFVSGL